MRSVDRCCSLLPGLSACDTCLCSLDIRKPILSSACTCMVPCCTHQPYAQQYMTTCPGPMRQTGPWYLDKIDAPQVALEGAVSKKAAMTSLAQGLQPQVHHHSHSYLHISAPDVHLMASLTSSVRNSSQGGLLHADHADCSLVLPPGPSTMRTGKGMTPLPPVTSTAWCCRAT